MAYLALYRKYRPQTFDEIVGQRAVVTALKNQVRSGEVGHAYLFCGTRGTGKTSTARVFARAVNCLHPSDGNPCNECERCRESENGFNLIEIDAASNNSVDNIRDLRKEVQYPPAEGKYKIYIIDEVHMLYPAAQNALLKTLEEPPSHAIFVLATTDPQKLLPTITSRCQRYDFRRISTSEMIGHLEEVCQKESIQADKDALGYIAAQASGGMRDALSILDQCHSYYMNEPITLGKVREVLGAVDDQVFETMTEALYDNDLTALLEELSKAFDDGRDAVQFAEGWIRYLRDVLVAKALGSEDSRVVMTSEEELAVIRQQASKIPSQLLTSWIRRLAKASSQLRISSQQRVLMEVTIIEMMAPAGEGNTTVKAAPVRRAQTKTERKSEPGTETRKAVPSERETPQEKDKRQPGETSSSAASKKTEEEMLENISSHWQEILQAGDVMRISHICRPAEVTDGSLTIAINDKRFRNFVEANLEDIRKGLREVTGWTLGINIVDAGQPGRLSKEDIDKVFQK